MGKTDNRQAEVGKRCMESSTRAELGSPELTCSWRQLCSDARWCPNISKALPLCWVGGAKMGNTLDSQAKMSWDPDFTGIS